jgi:hypothetical protein
MRGSEIRSKHYASLPMSISNQKTRKYMYNTVMMLMNTQI